MTLFSSYGWGASMHCAVQTLFRPCSDHVQTRSWVQTQSSAARLPLLTPMSFFKDSTDVRNMTHYRLILGRRGLSSSNGGRSTDTSTTGDSLMIPTFCERSSLALLSPLQRDTPTTTATDTGSTPPTTPFVLGAPLVTTTTRYQDLAGSTPPTLIAFTAHS